MLRIFSIVLTLLLMTFRTAAYADPPGRVARLNHVSGAVSFAPAEAPGAWTQAVLNRPLTAGDRLWADQTGRAELHVGSMAIRLAELTSVDVLNLDDQTTQLRLAQGAVNVRVRDLAPGETVEIATPTGAVLLRQPGSYRVSTGPQGNVSRVLVHFGQAEVITPTQTVTVPSSQSAVISAGAGIAFEVAAYASADDFDRWSAERDRREDRVTSTRYVSRDMTGYEDLDQYGSWRTLPEYGAVWVPARVAAGWAPYRNGHWAWVSPWGWTWIDDAPWGFAPFHYGRWVYTDSYWAWAPGRIERRPVYAPALVAFVGGSSFSVSVSSGPAIGWFPLGWREPYRPWYRASPAHVHNVNVTNVNVTNVTNVTNIYNNDVTNQYVNRNRREAVTVVPQQVFVSARPVAQSSLNVSPAELARAEVVRDRQPAEPVRASIAPERAGQRPPAQAVAREVVAVNPPATPAARDVPAFRDRASFTRADDAEPRVRVLRSERDRQGVGVAAPAVERAMPQAATQPAAQPQRAPLPPASPRDNAAPATSTAATPAGAPAGAAPLMNPAPAAPSIPPAARAPPPAAAPIQAAPATTVPPARPATAAAPPQAAPPARPATAAAPPQAVPPAQPSTAAAPPQAAPPARPATAAAPPQATAAAPPAVAPRSNPTPIAPMPAASAPAPSTTAAPAAPITAAQPPRPTASRAPDGAMPSPTTAPARAADQDGRSARRDTGPRTEAAPARITQPPQPRPQHQEERTRGGPPASREGAAQRPGRDSS